MAHMAWPHRIATTQVPRAHARVLPIRIIRDARPIPGINDGYRLFMRAGRARSEVDSDVFVEIRIEAI